MVKTKSGVELGGNVTHVYGEGISNPKIQGIYIVSFHFQNYLNPGLYFINAGILGLINDQEIFLHRILDAVAFQVIPAHDQTATGFIDFCCSKSGNINMLQNSKA